MSWLQTSQIPTISFISFHISDFSSLFEAISTAFVQIYQKNLIKPFVDAFKRKFIHFFLSHPIPPIKKRNFQISIIVWASRTRRKLKKKPFNFHRMRMLLKAGGNDDCDWQGGKLEERKKKNGKHQQHRHDKEENERNWNFLGVGWWRGILRKLRSLKALFEVEKEENENF